MNKFLVCFGIVAILGLSWINLWFALVGFISIGLAMLLALINSANE